MWRSAPSLIAILVTAGSAAAETRIEATMGVVLTNSMDERDRTSSFDDRRDQDAGFLTGVTVTTSAGQIGRLGAAFHSTMYGKGSEVYHLGAVAGITPSWQRNFRLVFAVEAGVASFRDLGQDEHEEFGTDVTVTGGETDALFPYAGLRLGFEHDLFASGDVAIGLWMHLRGDLGEATNFVDRTRCEEDAPCTMEQAELDLGGIHAGLFVMTLSMKL